MTTRGDMAHPIVHITPAEITLLLSDRQYLNVKSEDEALDALSTWL